MCIYIMPGKILVVHVLLSFIIALSPETHVQKLTVHNHEYSEIHFDSWK